MNNTSEVLIDLGVALVAFGTALKEAGTRLQTTLLQPAVALQAAAVATAAQIAGRLSRKATYASGTSLAEERPKGAQLSLQ
jgi:hypothetical protein